MKHIKVLAIGNSFSVDATTYLHQFSLCGKTEITVGNLHFGGCSFSQHWSFYQAGQALYEYYKNGVLIKYGFSLVDALKDEDWDIITIQQKSSDSGDYSTFGDGVKLVHELRKRIRHTTEIVLHQTWSYAAHYRDEQFRKYAFDQKLMDVSISNAYSLFADELGVKRVILSGEAYKLARSVFGDNLNRDGFHANEKGRYLLAALWYGFLSGEDVRFINFQSQGFSYEENKEKGPTTNEGRTLRDIAYKISTRE